MSAYLFVNLRKQKRKNAAYFSIYNCSILLVEPDAYLINTALWQNDLITFHPIITEFF